MKFEEIENQIKDLQVQNTLLRIDKKMLSDKDKIVKIDADIRENSFHLHRLQSQKQQKLKYRLMSNQKDHITITGKDLDSEEKQEQFVELFGRNELIKAQTALSEQVWGDGAIEKLEAKMGTKNLNDEKQFKEYGELRSKWLKESNRLKPLEKAEYKLPVGMDLPDRVFNKRNVAKDYLGVERFSEIVYPAGSPQTDRDVLKKMNPHLKKYNNDIASQKEKVQELEAKLKEMKKDLV